MVKAEPIEPTGDPRWHLPRRGARRLEQVVVGPLHEDWNYLGQGVNRGKEELAKIGIRFDADLAIFDQYTTGVLSGRQNFGSFAWRIVGDWQMFDLDEHAPVSALGKGFVGWTT